MILKELIAALEAADSRMVVPHGFTNPHSYRGYYEQLAFEPAQNVTVDRMLADARFALDATFEGYKGGDFTMTEDTDCWLATWGALGETLGPTLLRLMLEAGTVQELTPTEELHAAARLMRGEPAPEPHPIRLPPKMPDAYMAPTAALLDEHAEDHVANTCKSLDEECPHLRLARAITGATS